MRYALFRGPTDVVGRFLAQKLTEQLGHNVIVDNRAGGNATIGGNEVAKSAPDGYALLFNASIFTITPFLSKPLPLSEAHAELLREAVDAAEGELDNAAIIRHWRAA
jgi:tripartite-type tricarboxylate transporter receptor subunit TctC